MRKLSLLLLLLAAACSKKSNTPGAPAGGNVTVSTVTPNMTYGVGGITADSKGNVYFSLTTAAVVYKMVPGSAPTVYAGISGDFGFDNGAGASATFTDPAALAIDASGNILVADFLYTGLRFISSSDQVATLVANGLDGPQAVCVDGSGNAYTATEMGSDGIMMVTTGGVASLFAGDGNTGYKDGALASAEFTSITGLCTDGKGTIYVADDGKIRKISGGQVSTLAGNGHGYADGKGAGAQFAGAMGLCLDSKGNIYVADTYDDVIRFVTPDGTVTTLAGTGNQGATDGPGQNATFYEPTNLCFGSDGNLYVADYGNDAVRKIVIK